MARNRHTDEYAFRLLRDIELRLASGNDVTEACRKAGDQRCHLLQPAEEVWLCVFLADLDPKPVLAAEE